MTEDDLIFILTSLQRRLCSREAIKYDEFGYPGDYFIEMDKINGILNGEGKE